MACLRQAEKEENSHCPGPGGAGCQTSGQPGKLGNQIPKKVRLPRHAVEAKEARHPAKEGLPATNLYGICMARALLGHPGAIRGCTAIDGGNKTEMVTIPSQSRGSAMGRQKGGAWLGAAFCCSWTLLTWQTLYLS